MFGLYFGNLKHGSLAREEYFPALIGLAAICIGSYFAIDWLGDWYRYRNFTSLTPPIYSWVLIATYLVAIVSWFILAFKRLRNMSLRPELVLGVWVALLVILGGSGKAEFIVPLKAVASLALLVIPTGFFDEKAASAAYMEKLEEEINQSRDEDE